MCFDRISIGERVEVTWDCQIYDTSFHYIIKEDGICGPLTIPIEIGNHVWIGNRTTVSKGAKIPSNSIVASNSLVSKDFSRFGEGILIAGIPAQVKQEGVERVYNGKQEAELDKQFGYVRTHL